MKQVSWIHKLYFKIWEAATMFIKSLCTIRLFVIIYRANKNNHKMPFHITKTH